MSMPNTRSAGKSFIHPAIRIGTRRFQTAILGLLPLAFLAGLPAVVGIGRAAGQEDPGTGVRDSVPQVIEVRAIHVAAEDWVSADPAQCRANIQQIFDNLKRGGFNTAFFQAREGAEVLFPSRLEPWSGRFGRKDPGFDPLKLAIERGHRNGIKVYAWVSAMTLGPCDPPAPTPGPDHLFVRHGPKASDSWVCRAEDGSVMQCRGEYYLSPGIPEVQAHVRGVVMSLVQSYPELDGLYFDKVEYPGPETSRDPVSVRRYKERGNPNLAYWDDWQREQLTRFLIDVFAQARRERPTLVIGVSAPGIYSRSRFEGNPGLPSGYHDHYQDAKAWVDADAVDFVVPRITAELIKGGPERFYYTLMEDAFELYEEPRLVAGIDIGAFKPGTMTEEWVRYPMKTGGLGVAGLSYGTALKANVWDELRETAFTTPVSPMPLGPAERAGRGGMIVIALDADGKPVVDARVKLEGVRSSRTTSGDGLAAFLELEPGEKMLHIEYAGAPPAKKPVSVEAGKIEQVSVPLRDVGAASPVYFEILDPADGKETTSEAVNVLGRTHQAKSATVNGVDAPILSTGLLVRDQIPLQMGKNTIEMAVTGEGGQTARRTVEVVRVPEPTPTPLPPSFPLFIDEKSFEPNEEVRLAPGEMLRVAFRGAPDNIAEYRLPWTDWIRLEEETIPGTSKGTGRYALTRAFTRQEDARPGNIEVRLRVPDEASLPGTARGPRSIEHIPENGISIYGNERYRLLRIRDETGHLVHGLHSVRLGGPYLAELPQGTFIRVTGRRGDYYRVRLTDTLDAWIPIGEVENVSPITPAPHLAFTSISIAGDDRNDIITIPYAVPVPFRVRPVTEPGRPAVLEIDFFYAHDAATWISHKPTAKVVRIVTTEQVSNDHLRVRAELRTEQIWGYKTEVDGKALRITVRRPPALTGLPESPLKGLTVGVEAGHGGPGMGAIGVSGTPEKLINRWTSDELMEALTAKGASVVDCRIGDESVSLDTRIRRAEGANADMFISVHANAASQARGYLRVSGTSTYYKWPFSFDFSDAIHARLLEMTGLGDFGNVGNFNYTPIRTTWMPAMLVELAFMSNPEDEAKMLDPLFRKTMVNAIVLGTEDFLRLAGK